MRLWHVSEDPSIAHFVPRVPPSFDAGVAHPVVWAVDDAHLVNYLLPRECPRVALRRGLQSTQADIDRYFGASSAEVVLYIETAWQERADATPIYLYALPSAPFQCADANAGYFVADCPVSPLATYPIQSPSSALLARGVDLRVIPDLRAIARAIALSTLSFSIIRLRNAA